MLPTTTLAATILLGRSRLNLQSFLLSSTAKETIRRQQFIELWLQFYTRYPHHHHHQVAVTMDKIRRLSDNASHLQVCLFVCLYNAFVPVVCLCSTREVSYRASWCSTPLAGAPARGLPPSLWRRSPLTTIRWPGLSLPSIHHLRFKVLQTTIPSAIAYM